MTKLALSDRIRSCLRDMEFLTKQLGSHDLNDAEQCHQAVEEITQLYASVALCRSMIEQMESLHKEVKVRHLGLGSPPFALSA